MKAEELETLQAANETLERLRRIRVHVKAIWAQLDDLSPEAESELLDGLRGVLDRWAEAHGRDLEVTGPVLDVEKYSQYALQGWNEWGGA